MPSFLREPIHKLPASHPASMTCDRHPRLVRVVRSPDVDDYALEVRVDLTIELALDEGEVRMFVEVIAGAKLRRSTVEQGLRLGAQSGAVQECRARVSAAWAGVTKAGLASVGQLRARIAADVRSNYP